jgi:hypothetical protein
MFKENSGNLIKKHFYVGDFNVNNVAIDFENAQIMCCILCHKKSIIITNPKK